jgi:hypothetical protein
MKEVVLPLRENPSIKINSSFRLFFPSLRGREITVFESLLYHEFFAGMGMPEGAMLQEVN